MMGNRFLNDFDEKSLPGLRIFFYWLLSLFRHENVKPGVPGCLGNVEGSDSLCGGEASGLEGPGGQDVLPCQRGLAPIAEVGVDQLCGGQTGLSRCDVTPVNRDHTLGLGTAGAGAGGLRRGRRCTDL